MTAADSIKPQAGAGLPSEQYSLSFWLAGTRTSPLLGHRTTPDLPEEADLVIIGAGFSGASTAYFALTGPNPPKRVVVLDAREVCHGATGRNGGHCRPDAYRGFTQYKATFGEEQALKIIANEVDNLDLTEDVIKKEGIDCDFWRGTSLDIAMDQECVDAFSATLKEFKAAGGRADIVEWVGDTAEAKKVSRCPSALAAAIFPGASLWPYKLVLGLLNICLSNEGFNLQTTTPVLSVDSDPSAPGRWLVKTPRGTIRTAQVVHTTNAYGSALLPEFSGKIEPLRGQCSSIVPTKPFAAGSERGPLEHTCGFYWAGERRSFDYLIQRPKDGIVILGGGGWLVPAQTVVGQTDDSMLYPEITKHLKGACSEYFENWGKEAIGEGLQMTWTGIMGFTPDSIPFVGPVHGKPGQFINAGHNGHGMARIMSCGRGLAALLRGQDWSTTQLPECFEPNPDRLGKRLPSVLDQVKTNWR